MHIFVIFKNLFLFIPDSEIRTIDYLNTILQIWYNFCYILRLHNCQVEKNIHTSSTIQTQMKRIQYFDFLYLIVWCTTMNNYESNAIIWIHRYFYLCLISVSVSLFRNGDKNEEITWDSIIFFFFYGFVYKWTLFFLSSNIDLNAI